MSTGKSVTKTPDRSANVIQLFNDLAFEVYYGANFTAELYECSDEFLSTLRQFVDQCKSDRTGNELPATTE